MRDRVGYDCSHQQLRLPGKLRHGAQRVRHEDGRGLRRPPSILQPTLPVALTFRPSLARSLPSALITFSVLSLTPPPSPTLNPRRPSQVFRDVYKPKSARALLEAELGLEISDDAVKV